MVHILKENDVKLEGRFLLSAEQPVPKLKNQKAVASAVPQAHIVENTPEFAVIEVTCRCGTKARIRCEYADTPVAQQVHDNNDGGNTNGS